VTLQQGIGWNAAHQTGGFFGLVCLRRTMPPAASGQSAAAVADLWDRYRLLRHGELPDLDGCEVDPGGLQVLIGYGARALAGLDETVAVELQDCAFAGPAGDRGVLPGVALRYAPDLVDNPADADLVVQVTAQTQTAVTRAVVETRRRLADPAAPGHGALSVSGAFLGYRRDDQRSWIGFHDGVDNIDTRERLNAIQVGEAADDAWLRGGSYLAFLRIVIDVEGWDRLPVERQELLVGRDKHSGTPLMVNGGKVVRAPLMPGTTDVMAPANLGMREPLPVDLADPTGLGRSHVQRARRHSSLRMFRQGYEFVETLGADPFLRVGLNFVAFQASPLPLVTALRTGSWLGGVAFSGGPDSPAPPDLLTVRAAGLFAVPPAAGLDVPGLAAVWPSR
jgi:deferrochelatase/peroxidase EfeB